MDNTAICGHFPVGVGDWDAFLSTDCVESVVDEVHLVVISAVIMFDVLYNYGWNWKGFVYIDVNRFLSHTYQC